MLQPPHHLGHPAPNSLHLVLVVLALQPVPNTGDGSRRVLSRSHPSPGSPPARTAQDVGDSTRCQGTVGAVTPVWIGWLQKPLSLALLWGCCLPGAEGGVGRQGWLLPSQLPFRALGVRVALCPAVSCSSSGLPQLLLGSPLSHSAPTHCLSSCPMSLPASVSPKTFLGSPGQRQGRSRAKRTSTACEPVWCHDQH